MNKASSDSQIDKPQRGHSKRAELPDVNINMGAQSINTEKASLTGYPRTVLQGFQCALITFSSLSGALIHNRLDICAMNFQTANNTREDT